MRTLKQLISDIVAVILAGGYVFWMITVIAAVLTLPGCGRGV